MYQYCHARAGMPSLSLSFGGFIGIKRIQRKFWPLGSITTNTSDMPAALKAIGDMFASPQLPMTPDDEAATVWGGKTKTIGPFSKQVFKVAGELEIGDVEIYKVALIDALEPLGWKLVTSETLAANRTYILFAKQEAEHQAPPVHSSSAPSWTAA